MSLPPELGEALEARGARVLRSWREAARSYVVAESGEGPLFARASDDPADEAVLRHEAAVRSLVGREGPLRAPRVLASGERWLLEERVDSGSHRGPESVDLVVGAVERIAELDLPQAPGQGRRRLLGALARIVRLARSPLPLSDVLEARRIVSDPELPLVPGHGDFHAGNVLLADGAAWVVDWELSGRYPAGYDLMWFWPTLEDAEDRARLFAAAVELVGRNRLAELTRLRYALLVRAIAGNLAGEHVFNRDPETARSLLTLLPGVRRDAGGGR